MAFDYVEAAQTAKELIEEFGSLMTINRYRTVQDPITERPVRTLLETQQLSGVVLPASSGTLEAFDVRFMEGLFESTNIRFCILEAASAKTINIGPTLDEAVGVDWSNNVIEPSTGVFMPQFKDELINFDGTWEILGCTPLNVAGVPIIFSVGLREP